MEGCSCCRCKFCEEDGYCQHHREFVNPHKDGCHEGVESAKEDKIEDLSQWYPEYI